MKISILLIAAFIGISYVNGFTVPNTVPFTKQSNAFLARTISEIFISKLKQDLRSRPYSQDTMATLLPPIDDPACLPAGSIPVNVTIPDLLTVNGNLDFTTSSEVLGLSKLVDDFNLIAITGVVNYTVDIPAVSISGGYNMDLNLNLGSDHKVVGSGDFSASVNNVFLKLRAKLKITPPSLGLLELNVDLGFKDLTVNGGEATVDETTIDWVTVGNNIQTYFDTLWGSEAREIIIEMIRCAVDDFINECKLADLIAGNLECLKDTIKLECFETGTTGGTEGPTGSTAEPTGSTVSSTGIASEEPTGGSTGGDGSEEPTVSTTQKAGALSTTSSIAMLSILIANFIF